MHQPQRCLLNIWDTATLARFRSIHINDNRLLRMRSRVETTSSKEWADSLGMLFSPPLHRAQSQRT